MSAILLTGVVVSGPRVQAQPPVHSPFLDIGIEAAYGVADHAIDGLSCQSGCPEYTSAVGGGVALGPFLAWYLTDRAGVTLHADFYFSSVSMKAESNGLGARDQNGNVVPFVWRHTLDVGLHEVLVDLSGFVAFDRWRVNAGGAVGFLVNPTWSSTGTIVSPSNVTYPGGSTDTTFFPAQSLSNARGTQVYMRAGASYDVPIGPRLVLAPGVRVLFPLTDIRADTRWKETVIDAGLALRYAWLFHVPEPPRAPESGGGRN